MQEALRELQVAVAREQAAQAALDQYQQRYLHAQAQFNLCVMQHCEEQTNATIPSRT
jgi:hypothetical protein